MIRIFFWLEDGTGLPIEISTETYQLLQVRVRNGRKTQDILEDIFDLFGDVNEVLLLSYLYNINFSEPN